LYFSTLVPSARLELAQLSPLPPQDSVSTNFTTTASDFNLALALPKANQIQNKGKYEEHLLQPIILARIRVGFFAAYLGISLPLALLAAFAGALAADAADAALPGFAAVAEAAAAGVAGALAPAAGAESLSSKPVLEFLTLPLLAK
jgi:hypothetical protein